MDDGALEVTLSHAVLLAVTGATGVELVVTLMKLGPAEVEEDQTAHVSDAEEELVTTGFTGVVEGKEVVVVEFAASHGPQDVDEELVTTGWTGVTGMNDETEVQGPHDVELLLGTTGDTGVLDEELLLEDTDEDDHGPHAWDEELVTTGLTGVVEEELDTTDEVVQAAQVSEDELVTTGLTGVVEEEEEEEELDDDHTPHVSEELLLGTTGITGMTGVVEDEDEDDEEVQAAQTSDDEELVMTGLTGVVGEEDEELELADDHGPHTADEELEHTEDDVMVVVTVTGGMGM